MSGYSRRGSLPKETRPKTINSSEITEANTGRLTETSDRIIGLGLSGPGFSSWARGSSAAVHGNNGHRLSRPGAQGPVNDHEFTGLEAVENLDFTRSAAAGGHLATLGERGFGGSIHDQHVVFATGRNQCFLGNHQHVPGIFQQLDLHQQTRFKQTLRIG